MSVESGWEKVLPFFEDELQALILDPTISDLMINGTTGVYADRGGVVEHIELRNAYSVDRLEAAIQRVARMMGQDLTSQNPILNTRMPDGSRVAVVGAPSAIGGPTLTIRKFNRWYSTDELIGTGSMPAVVRDRIVAFLMGKKNGIIAGGTGSGKTTLMKACLDHVPMTDRLIVIEQVAELRCAGRPSMQFQVKLPSCRAHCSRLHCVTARTGLSSARYATSARTTCCRR